MEPYTRGTTMPKLNCKGMDCKNVVRIPPNREATATGYCRECWYGEIKKQWLKN